MPGEGDDPATVENIDARIDGSDGTCYYATFLTTNEIACILTRWRRSGEVGGGRYFRWFESGRPDSERVFLRPRRRAVGRSE